MGGGGGPGREIPEQVIQDTLNNGEDFTLEENTTTNLTQNLIIPEGRTFTNNGTIDLGESGFEIIGNLVNNGTITNQNAQISLVDGSSVRNYGSIITDGTLKIQGEIAVLVEIFNFGTFISRSVEIIAEAVSQSGEIIFNLRPNSLTTFGTITSTEFDGDGRVTTTFTGGADGDPTAELRVDNIDTREPLILSNLILTNRTPIDGEWKVKELTLSNNAKIEPLIQSPQTRLSVSDKLTIENGPVFNKAIINIQTDAELEINESTLNNEGVIINAGTIKQLGTTNSSIQAEFFGKIETTGTVTGLNLKNQQIITDVDGIVIAGTKNENDRILNATAKTIEWDANYNPGAGDEDFKVKRTTADETKYEIEFVTGNIINDATTFPNGDPFSNNPDIYSSNENPGFLNTWYKEHDGLGNEPVTFGILVNPN